MLFLLRRSESVAVRRGSVRISLRKKVDEMKVVQTFSTKLLSPPTERSAPVSRLIFQGRDTGLELPGATLETSLEVGFGWLLFLTHDIPFEEGLEICLVGANFELLDRAALLPFNATGNFGSLEIVSDRILRFRFTGKGLWQLELLDHPGFRLPLLSEPFEATRPFGFTRRFILATGY